MVKIIKNIVISLYKLMFYVLGVMLPKNNKKVVFESFLGKQYSDNPRAIYEYLLKERPDLKMYWSFSKESHYIQNNKRKSGIKRFSLKWMWIMNTSKYWVVNSRLPLWIPKPKNTIYIQTWHGTPLKKLANDMKEVHMPGTTTNRYKKNFLTESQKWDVLISPNPYSTEIFKKAFMFNKKIVESGYPRNDYLINNNHLEKIKSLKNKMNLPLNKKIILYAPTWRDNDYYGKGKYKFSLKLDLDLLKESLGNEFVILLRLHYLVSENINLDKYEGFVFNYSTYEDIRDLYLVSDILITDYSSVFFDYAILKRPMIFFVYDIEEYRDQLRGFYFDIENEAPGPIVKSTNEIIELLKKNNNGHIDENKYNEFLKKFCSLEDGNASKRISCIFE